MPSDNQSVYDLPETVGGTMINGTSLLNDEAICEFCKDAPSLTIG